MTTLRILNISNTKISNIFPLANLPLEILVMSSTDVQDLSPITNMPLQILEITKSPIINLNILIRMDIHSLIFDPWNFDAEQLNNLRLNGYQKKQYWKGFEDEIWSKCQ